MPRATEIERLYDEHAQPLFAFLLNFTRDESDTRDVLQEIFIKLAREPKLLAGVREERAFLIRLAHLAVNFCKSLSLVTSTPTNHIFLSVSIRVHLWLNCFRADYKFEPRRGHRRERVAGGD